MAIHKDQSSVPRSPAQTAAAPEQTSDSPSNDIVVGPVSDIPPGTMKLVEVGRFGIGVYNVNGAFHALANLCPHRGAPLCRGEIRGIVVAGDHPYEQKYIRKGEILRCPWHGWEFEIESGRSAMFSRIKARTYQVSVQDGNIVVHGVSNVARQR
jgi:nitrite reductase/ring-hydroxylating ferredoxin subunit